MANLTNVHTERVFEDEVCAHLSANGWSVRTHLKNATSYERERAILVEDLLAFVQETQKEWAKFKKWHNGQSETMFIKRGAEQLDKHGTLHVLRHGFKDRDARFFLCQLRPAHKKNPHHHRRAGSSQQHRRPAAQGRARDGRDASDAGQDGVPSVFSESGRTLSRGL